MKKLISCLVCAAVWLVPVKAIAEVDEYVFQVAQQEQVETEDAPSSACTASLQYNRLTSVDFVHNKKEMLPATSVAMLSAVASTVNGEQNSADRIVIVGDVDRVGLTAGKLDIAKGRAHAVATAIRKFAPTLPIITTTRWSTNVPQIAKRAPRQRKAHVIAQYFDKPSQATPAKASSKIALSRFKAGAPTSPVASTYDLGGEWPFAGRTGTGGALEFWLRVEKGQVLPKAEVALISVNDSENEVRLLFNAERSQFVIERKPLGELLGDRERASGERFLFDAHIAYGNTHHVVLNDLQERAEFWLDGRQFGTSISAFPLRDTKAKVLDISVARERRNLGSLAISLGEMRLWKTAHSCNVIKSLMETPNEDLRLPVAGDELVATSEISGAGLDLRLLSKINYLEGSSFVEAGTDRVFMRSEDVSKPDMSTTLRSRKVYRDSFYTRNEKHKNRYSDFPVFMIEHLPAGPNRAIRSSFVGSASPNLRSLDLAVPQGGRLVRMRAGYGNVRTRKNGVQSVLKAIQLEYVINGSTKIEVTPWYGSSKNNTAIHTFPCNRTFARDTQIQGITGHASDQYIYNLSLVTSLNTGPSGCIQGRKGRAPKDAKPFTKWLPELAEFGGFTVKAKEGIDGLALLSAADPRVASIVVRREDGKSETFQQIARNTYKSNRRFTIFPQERRSAFPTLRVLRPDTFTITGVDRDFVSTREKPNPIGSKADYDDTFVSNFKAVNLRANFGSYHVVRMDPLHLLNRGTNRLIFKQPTGDSVDYHDYDRMFVPDGLEFLPEFSGQSVTKTTMASSATEFKQHFSNSVGGSVGGSAEGVGGSFNFSQTMSRASERIHEEEVSLAIGTSKVSLYSLVLDKANMALKPEFLKRVLRLEYGSDADYDRFVDDYGTHYARGVEYGGLGVLTAQVKKTTDGNKTLRSSEFQAGFKAEVAGASIGANVSKSRSTERGSTLGSEVSLDQFYFVGGAHAGGTRESWGVGEEGAVPVYVELMPLDELLAPPFFLNQSVSRFIRPRLKKTIDKVIREANALADAERLANQQHEFEITLKELTAASLGDDGVLGNGVLEIYGKLDLQLDGVIRRMTTELPLFSRSRTESKAVSPFGSSTSFSHLPGFAFHLPGELPKQSFVVSGKNMSRASVKFTGLLKDEDGGAFGNPDDTLKLRRGGNAIHLSRIAQGHTLIHEQRYRGGKCSDSCTIVDATFEIKRHVVKD